MKKTLLIGLIAVIAIVAFTGLMGSLKPQSSQASMVNHENLIFTFIQSADTTTSAIGTKAHGDSVLAVTNLTSSDEIRFAWKMHKYAPQSGDSSFYMINYTDSLTKHTGYVTPAYWTYKDVYLIIWRDLTP
jgi:hypothetical protein